MEGTPTVSTYDVTDQLLTQGPQGGTLLSFNYDPHGNMIQSAETFNTGVTAYSYDLGDRLTKITPPAGLSGAQTFTLDALGRIATETTGSTTTTMSYVGTSKTVSRLATGSTNVDSLLGSDGSRLATVSGSSFGWLIPDLHGDIAGASSASLATITDALRYDAFGTIAASTTSALPTPWRYQGELLVNPAGASDLYADGARFYAPGLGVFTQLDTAQGSALNPLSLNRFLYAAANPETMIDPSGHTTIDEGDAYNSTLVHDSTHKHTTTRHLSGIQKYPGENWKQDYADRKAARKQQLADDRAHFAQLRHVGLAADQAQDWGTAGVTAASFASQAAGDLASSGGARDFQSSLGGGGSGFDPSGLLEDVAIGVAIGVGVTACIAACLAIGSALLAGGAALALTGSAVEAAGAICAVGCTAAVTASAAILGLVGSDPGPGEGAEPPDSLTLVRGGTNTVDRVLGGTGVEVDAAGNVHGVSVNSGTSVKDAARGIPNKQVGVSAVGKVRAAGGYVQPDPLPDNPGHCLVGGISAAEVSGLFTPTIANPCL